jgi:aminoglycoside phosphotransferase (APT) family kinase protein
LEAERIQESAGLEPLSELRVASGTSLFRAGDRVVRVAAPGRSAIGTKQIVELAGLYASYGIPVAAPLAPPTVTPQGDEVSVWEYVPNDPEQAFPARQVGGVLKDLHGIPLASVEEALGFAPPQLGAALSRGRKRLDILSADSQGFEIDMESAQRLFDAAEAAAQAAFEREEEVLLHGDMNPGNVLYGEGDVRLCDFEACTRGPWVWDLVNTQLQTLMGYEPQERMDELVAGYGQNPEDSSAWAPLCTLRAINIVTFKVLEAAAGSPAGDDAAAWVEWMNAGFPGVASGDLALSSA